MIFLFKESEQFRTRRAISLMSLLVLRLALYFFFIHSFFFLSDMLIIIRRRLSVKGTSACVTMSDSIWATGVSLPHSNSQDGLVLTEHQIFIELYEK